ncbi:MAG: DUF4037 domain-containing protein [Prochloron sp. SP5CPC1]|nr:DUF4037 domain-containing protein [Candidatus Paraprochloron terpiosi SP5CPC1]
MSKDVEDRSIPPAIAPLASTLADRFAVLPQTIAIVLAGSQSNGAADAKSDYDFYVYSDREISVADPFGIAQEFADHAEINNQFWEPGDEWIDRDTGFHIDIMYRDPNWSEGQLERLLKEYQASVGYSTCFWWNILTSIPLYDPKGWFQQLQTKVNQPYPKALQQAIIAKNYPILRQNQSSYLHQIELALDRQDIVSVTHRISALLASYFDIIFAVNEVPHPGEKRLVSQVNTLCKKQPEAIALQINNITQAMGSLPILIPLLNLLIDDLDQLLIQEGYITESGQLI